MGEQFTEMEEYTPEEKISADLIKLVESEKGGKKPKKKLFIGVGVVLGNIALLFFITYQWSIFVFTKSLLLAVEVGHFVKTKADAWNLSIKSICEYYPATLSGQFEKIFDSNFTFRPNSLGLWLSILVIITFMLALGFEALIYVIYKKIKK
jgi:hypothetical protein